MKQLLNDDFTKTVDYRSYRLERGGVHYLASATHRLIGFRKKIDVKMQTHTFSGQDIIAAPRVL